MTAGANRREPIDDVLFAAPRRARESDERYTPGWVFDGLGLVFDLDPAAALAGDDHVPARTRWTRLDDGLSRPWFGLVWCNPPFANAAPFADRFREHGAGVFLGPVANARWCVDLVGAARLVWFVRDFPFDHPTHPGRRSSMPLAFVAMGDAGAAGLDRLARSGRHSGVRLVPAA